MPGSPSAGHGGAALCPGAGDLGVPLTGSVACCALLLPEDTVLPIQVTWAPGGRASLLAAGGQAADPEAFLGRRPGEGRGWPRSLTLRQVFVSPESTVNPGVSLPRSVLCSFLIFINAYCNLNLRLTPVQFRGDTF